MSNVKEIKNKPVEIDIDFIPLRVNSLNCTQQEGFGVQHHQPQASKPGKEE